MSYEPDWTKWLRRLGLALILCLAIGGLYLVFGKMDDATKAKLYLEAAKSLMYLISVLLVGALTAALVKSFESSRKADKLIHDFRSEFLQNMQVAQQRIEKCRHTLAASGLSTRFGPAPRAFGTAQVAVYETQIAEFLEAASDIDRLLLDVSRFPDSFAEHVRLELALKSMRAYLAALLSEYRQYSTSIRSTPAEFAVSQLEKLLDLTGYQPNNGYVKDVSDAYERAVGYVRQDLLPLKAVAQGGAAK